MTPDENCPKIEALSALIDNELADAARVALDAHVAECAICAPMLAELRQMQSAFSALPDIALSIDLAPLVERRIAAAAAPQPQPRQRRWRWWQLVPAAFGGAVLLSLGAYLGSALMLGSQVATPPAALQMAAFTAVPPGALCPALQVCNRTGR